MTSLLKADNVAPSAGGTPRNLPQGVAAAWANFNGAIAVPAIRSSLNVSSIVDLAVGYWQVVQASAMASAQNYVGLATNDPLNNGNFNPAWANSRPTSADRVTVMSGYLPSSNTGTPQDAAVVCSQTMGSLA